MKNPKQIYKVKNEIGDSPGGTVDSNLPAKTGAQIQSLIWEDSACHGATKPSITEPVL